MLQKSGIGRLFGPGTTTTDAVEYIRSWFEENRSGASPSVA